MNLPTLSAPRSQQSKWRNIWRAIGVFLVAALVLYVPYALIREGRHLNQLEWRRYLLVCIQATGLYLVSLGLQYVPWAQMISHRHRIGLLDLEFYLRAVILRRLPGLPWHWVGRVASYAAHTDVPPRTIAGANLVEWLLLLMSGAGLYAATVDLPAGLRIALVGAALTFSVGTAIAWAPKGRPMLRRAADGMLWTLAYALSWFLSVWILHLFVAASPSGPISWRETTRIWSLAAVLSVLILFLPSGLGLREAALVWQLQPHLPYVDALLIALLIRVVYSISDIGWGLIGWAAIRLAFRHRGAQEAIAPASPAPATSSLHSRPPDR